MPNGTESIKNKEQVSELWEKILCDTENKKLYSDDDFSGSIYGINDLREKVIHRHTEGVDRGEDLSMFLDGEPGKLARPSKKNGSVWLGTGYPGHGKSMYVDGLAMFLAKRKNWKVVIASFENMPPDHYLTNSLIPKWTSIPKNKIQNDQVNRCLDEMENKVFLLNPPENQRDITSLISMAEFVSEKRTSLDEGLLFIIDPWNEVEPFRDKTTRSLSESEYISQCLSRLRMVSRSDHRMTVIVIAHPVKVYPNRDIKIDKTGNPIGATVRRCNLTDVAGSYSWRAKIDVGFSIHRLTEPALNGDPVNEAELTVMKARFADTAKIGRCTLKYNSEIQGFH